MNTGEQRRSGLGTDVIVYLCLLALSALQFIQAYSGGEGRGLVARLLMVAALQALIAILFFMHLRAERRSLVAFVTVFLLFVLATMNYGWPDSFRLLGGAPFAK
jgi:caa(3)-type oxidase subunit IV